MRFLLCFLAWAWMLPAWAVEDIDKVNGSIRIEAGQSVGKLSTVNGSIHVGADCRVGSAETVNGQISLGERTAAGDLETVNGAVELAAGASASHIETVNGTIDIGATARVKGKLGTVNGSITLRQNAQVDGNIESANGRIALQRGAIAGAILAANGDIDIGPDARVGSIDVAKEKFSFFNWGKSKPPRVVIGPGATVQGTLTFGRDVELLVSERAKIGRVEGAQVHRFQGERP